MVVARWRKTFGVDSKSDRPRELSETEYAAICKVWRELSFLETTDRLIMVSRITGLSIGNAWPVLKEQDLIKPLACEAEQDEYTNDDDRLSDPNAQYGRI